MPRFKQPPRLVKIIETYIMACGINGSNNCQTLNTATAHHWIKKATTNIDMFLATVCDLFFTRPVFNVFSRVDVCSLIFIQVKTYKMMFMRNIATRGIVVNPMDAVLPLTASKWQLKDKQFCNFTVFSVYKTDKTTCFGEKVLYYVL